MSNTEKSKLSSMNTNTVSQQNNVAAAAGVAVPGVAVDQQYDYYNSDEYRKYYQQYYGSGGDTTSQAALTTGYTPEQVTAYYQNLAATDPQAYAAIYSQYYGDQSSTTNHQDATTGEDKTGGEEEDYDDDEEDPTVVKSPNGVLPIHCNDKMGLNPLIFANIQQSPYFRTTLSQIKSYPEIIDEIYFNVKHLEPWERGSRNASGITGMCGSVRGVSAGGIISTPFCVLYKLFHMRLTRNQVHAMLKHKDSPFIRGLGFLYLRFTQPPKDLYRWFLPYFDDDEEIDARAGGGSPTTIGKMVRKMLTKNDWFTTMFPRIPVPVQKEIDEKLRRWTAENGEVPLSSSPPQQQQQPPTSHSSSEHHSRNDKRSSGYARHDTDESRYRNRNSGNGTSHQHRSRSRSRSPSYNRDRNSGRSSSDKYRSSRY